MKAFLSLMIFLCCAWQLSAQEICNNGIDDDGNGLIDLNDTAACTCSGISGGVIQVPSLIPNPSFESYNTCPTGYSQMNYANGWIQASSATSDYMNTCGYVAPVVASAGLQPFPNGNGIVGAHFLQDYKEYVGSCLTQPMLAGQSYTIQMNIATAPADGSLNICNNGVIYYSPLDITIYGTDDCNNMPFAGYDCPPAPQWNVLGTANYTPASTWGIISITFTPTTDIYAIIIGSPCQLPPTYHANNGSCSQYFFFDNLLLNTTTSFNHTSVNTNGLPCFNNVVLDAHADTSGGTWQWYRDGIALVGQTDSILNVSANALGTGDYTAVFTIANQCATAETSVSGTSPDVTITGHTDNSCSGANDGSANTSLVNANGPVVYSWNTNPPQSTANASNMDAGFYTVTVTDSIGCITSDTVTIQPAPPSYVINNPQTVCAGNAYNINGHSYTNTGTYYDTLTAVGGCDSVIITDLTAGAVVTSNNPQSICSGGSYIFGGHSYNQPGIYYDTLQTVNGCDSVIETNLSVNPVLQYNNPQAICNGGSYTINNHSYNQAGVYQDTLQTVSGCDSVIITNLSINPVIQVNNPQAICIGGSYSINNHTYSQPGNYQDTLQSMTGCDSIIETNLSINPSFNVDNPQFICTGESYSINGHIYSQGGIYMDTMMTMAGCDSIVKTDITETPVPVLTATPPPQMCLDAAPLPMNFVNPPGGIYSGPGVNNGVFYPDQAHAGIHTFNYVYTDAITNCSATWSDDVTVWPLPEVNFTLDPKVIFLTDAGIRFNDNTAGAQQWQWDFGDSTNSPDKHGIHTYTDTGAYHVVLTVTDVHGCVSLNSDDVYIGLEYSFYIPNAFTPNGDGRNETFNGTGLGIGEYEMRIYNRWGEYIFMTDNLLRPWSGKGSPEGVYVYKVNLLDITGKPHEYIGSVTIVR